MPEIERLSAWQRVNRFEVQTRVEKLRSERGLNRKKPTATVQFRSKRTWRKSCVFMEHGL